MIRLHLLSVHRKAEWIQDTLRIILCGYMTFVWVIRAV